MRHWGIENRLYNHLSSEWSYDTSILILCQLCNTSGGAGGEIIWDRWLLGVEGLQYFIWTDINIFSTVHLNMKGALRNAKSLWKQRQTYMVHTVFNNWILPVVELSTLVSPYLQIVLCGENVRFVGWNAFQRYCYSQRFFGFRPRIILHKNRHFKIMQPQR